MRIEKKPKKIEVLFIAVSITVFIHTLHAQQTKDFAEPVEKKFNEWQPPEKIMDAMGLEAGLVLIKIDASLQRDNIYFFKPKT